MAEGSGAGILAVLALGQRDEAELKNHMNHAELNVHRAWLAVKSALTQYWFQPKDGRVVLVVGLYYGQVACTFFFAQQKHSSHKRFSALAVSRRVLKFQVPLVHVY